jgi:hypothetical protein
MQLECNNCKHRVGTPEASCGLGLILLLFLLFYFFSHFQILGFWRFLLPIPAWLFLLWLPGAMTWVRYAMFRCEKCGKRDWSGPFQGGGFGL